MVSSICPTLYEGWNIAGSSPCTADRHGEKKKKEKATCVKEQGGNNLHSLTWQEEICNLQSALCIWTLLSTSLGHSVIAAPLRLSLRRIVWAQNFYFFPSHFSFFLPLWNDSWMVFFVVVFCRNCWRKTRKTRSKHLSFCREGERKFWFKKYHTYCI